MMEASLLATLHCPMPLHQMLDGGEYDGTAMTPLTHGGHKFAGLYVEREPGIALVLLFQIIAEPA